MSATYANDGQKDMMDYLITNMGSNIRLGLYKAIAVTTKAAHLTDITACDFSGYAPDTPTFAAGSTDGNNKYVRAAGTTTFAHNGGGTGNTVLGYYVWDNIGGGTLWFFEAFSAPITMNASGQTIPVQPTWYMGDCTTPL